MARESALSAALSDEALDAIVAALPKVGLIADRDVLLRAGRRGAEMTGWEPREIEGLTIAEFCARFEVSDKDGRPLTEREIPLSRALNGEYVSDWEGYILHRGGGRIRVMVNAAPFLARDGGVIGAASSVVDVRKFEALERELRGAVDLKCMLYEELRHRVRNHMQILSALIGLEARQGGTVQRMAESLTMRMRGLAAIYETTGAESDRVAAGAFIEQIVSAYRTETIDVRVLAPKALMLSRELAKPLGMLVNEAVCNCFKHAFPSGSGLITVEVRPLEYDRLELEIADNGIGLDERVTNKPSLGRKLMQMQVQQLGGEMRLSNRPGGGARVVVDMPSDPGC